MSNAATGHPSGWTGTGQCVVGFAGGTGHAAGPMPAFLRRVPGPVLVVAARYETSPVGPYHELAVAQPVRAGARLGMCVTVIVVDSEPSRAAGRSRWGLPKELATLHWSAEGEEVALRWEERGLVVTGAPVGPAFPGLVPFRSLQARADGPVRFAGLVRGRGRLARVDVAVDSSDPLSCLAGRHYGVHLTRGALLLGEGRTLARRAARRG